MRALGREREVVTSQVVPARLLSKGGYGSLLEPPLRRPPAPLLSDPAALSSVLLARGGTHTQPPKPIHLSVLPHVEVVGEHHGQTAEHPHYFVRRHVVALPGFQQSPLRLRVRRQTAVFCPIWGGTPSLIGQERERADPQALLTSGLPSSVRSLFCAAVVLWYPMVN